MTNRCFKYLVIIKNTVFNFFGTQISRKAYFNGQSFIASTQKISFFDGFEGGFNFRTLQPNGLLFYYASGVSICFSPGNFSAIIVLSIQNIF